MIEVSKRLKSPTVVRKVLKQQIVGYFIFMKLKYLKGEFHEGLQRGEVPIRNMILMKLKTDIIKWAADQL